MFVLIGLQVVPFFWYGVGAITFGFVTHGLLVWLQRKHPFASDVFARIARGGNKPLVP